MARHFGECGGAVGCTRVRVQVYKPFLWEENGRRKIVQLLSVLGTPTTDLKKTISNLALSNIWKTKDSSDSKEKIPQKTSCSYTSFKRKTHIYQGDLFIPFKPAS